MRALSFNFYCLFSFLGEMCFRSWNQCSKSAAISPSVMCSSYILRCDAWKKGEIKIAPTLLFPRCFIVDISLSLSLQPPHTCSTQQNGGSKRANLPSKTLFGLLIFPSSFKIYYVVCSGSIATCYPLILQRRTPSTLLFFPHSKCTRVIAHTRTYVYVSLYLEMS